MISTQMLVEHDVDKDVAPADVAPADAHVDAAATHTRACMFGATADA